MRSGSTAKDIDAYIGGFPADVRSLLRTLRTTIAKAAPRATEKISYAIPTVYLKGNLVHFAGYKNHIGFYPGAAAIKEFALELSVYKGAKGSVQFPLDRPLPLGLVSRIVKSRVRQNLVKAKPAKRKK